MKLAIIYFGSAFFDGETYSSNAVQHKGFPPLCRHFDEVHLLLPVENSSEKRGIHRVDAEDVQIHHLPSIKSGFDLSVRKLPSTVFAIYRMLKKHRSDWDVVLLYEPLVPNQFAYVLCRLLRMPVVLRMTGRYDVTIRQSHQYSPLPRRIGAWLLSTWTRWVESRLGRSIVTVTDGDLGFLGGKTVKHKVVVCAENLVSREKMPANWVPPRPFSVGKPLRVLSLSRVHPVKGIHHLLEAAHILGQQGYDVQVDIVGPLYNEGYNNYEGKLRALIRELGLEQKATLWGWVEDGGEFWEQAHVMVVPSQAEGIPKVIFEAMGKGVPVVATTVGAIPLVVQHEQTGLLVSPGNPSELAVALKRLIQEPELARKMSRNAFDSVGNYSLEAVVASLADTIETAVPGRPTEPVDSPDRSVSL